MPPKGASHVDPEKADDLLVKFEKAALRLNKFKESPVKAKAAQKDLLNCAQTSAEFMNIGLKGDKTYLNETFGGEGSRRLHRFRQAIESTTLSEDQKDDPRWLGFSKQIDTTEKILREMGSFKPFVITTPPTKLEYPDAPLWFAPQDDYDVGPNVEGCAFDTLVFSVQPLLPQFLVLDEKTGRITGSPAMGAPEVPKRRYVFTALNSAGSTVCSLEFGIRVKAPESITYDPQHPMVGNQVEFRPNVEGGPPKTWSIEPELPKGLDFSTRSGVVHGIPVNISPELTFTIKGENASGKAETTLSFKVDRAPPTAVIYPETADNVDLPFGMAIYLIPEVEMRGAGGTIRRRSMGSMASVMWGKAGLGGPGGAAGSKRGWKKARSIHFQSLLLKGMLPDMKFTIEPALPEGLTLASTTGILQGMPTEERPRQMYTITARNDTGEASAHLNFGVRLGPPTYLEYDDVIDELYEYNPYQFQPAVEGFVSEYKIEPALPEGMHFDEHLGIISGVPDETRDTMEYTVTASNDKGSCECKFEFKVKRQAPAMITYEGQSADFAYAFDWPMATLNPQAHDAEDRPVAVDRYSIEPELSPGLSFDTTTGQVSGTPSELKAAVPYQISALNETGSCTTTLLITIKLIAPAELAYDGVDDVYIMQDEISAVPHLRGSANKWSSEPPLPEGIELNPTTGVISGSPKDVSPMEHYCISAANDEGVDSVVISFEVIAPPPTKLEYPEMQSLLTVGYECSAEVVVEPSAAGCSFTIQPELPEGLVMDAETGKISGTPTAPLESSTWTVTATNRKGSVTGEITFEIIMKVIQFDKNSKFSEQLEGITDPAMLPAEPKPTDNILLWMLFMVHRVYLNDPKLEQLDFSLLSMPLPHAEPRIAPKLMQALKTNTHLRNLHLPSTDLRPPQGLQLAEALKHNNTLQLINIESNRIDVFGLIAIADALRDNSESRVHTLRFSNQVSRNDNFGRQVEEHIAGMLEKNTMITKVGFSPQDAHWKNMISKFLSKNIDLQRRKRKQLAGEDPEDKPMELKPQKKNLTKVMLENAPTAAIWEVVDDDDEGMTALRDLWSEHKTMPKREHLMSHAKKKGHAIPFAKVAVIMKDFTTKILNSMVGLEMRFTDDHDNEYVGNLSAWKEANGRYNFDVQHSEYRYDFYAAKEPKFEASDDVAEWIAPVEEAAIRRLPTTAVLGTLSSA